MKKFKLLLLVSLFPIIGLAQENRPHECKADEMMKKHFELHPNLRLNMKILKNSPKIL